MSIKANDGVGSLCDYKHGHPVILSKELPVDIAYPCASCRAWIYEEAAIVLNSLEKIYLPECFAVPTSSCTFRKRASG